MIKKLRLGRLAGMSSGKPGDQGMFGAMKLPVGGSRRWRELEHFLSPQKYRSGCPTRNDRVIVPIRALSLCPIGVAEI